MNKELVEVFKQIVEKLTNKIQNLAQNTLQEKMAICIHLNELFKKIKNRELEPLFSNLEKDGSKKIVEKTSPKNLKALQRLAYKAQMQTLRS